MSIVPCRRIEISVPCLENLKLQFLSSVYRTFSGADATIDPETIGWHGFDTSTYLLTQMVKESSGLSEIKFFLEKLSNSSESSVFTSRYAVLLLK